MKRQEINIDGLYKIKEKDLEKCAKVAALAFLDDESSKYLLASNLTYEALYNYYLVIYKAAYKQMYMFAESNSIDGFIILTPAAKAELSIWECVKAGALKILFSEGFEIMLRSLEYERNCAKMRNRIALADSWYIFQLGIIPEKQGRKLGSKIIKAVLSWMDCKNLTCYLETQKYVNVSIYNHFGFSLKAVGTLPDKKRYQFAMFRNYNI